MHRFTIDIAFRMKKSGPINILKETFEEKLDAIACMTSWRALVMNPSSLVQSATLIEHIGDKTHEHYDKYTLPEQVTSNQGSKLHVVS